MFERVLNTQVILILEQSILKRLEAYMKHVGRKRVADVKVFKVLREIS